MAFTPSDYGQGLLLTGLAPTSSLSNQVLLITKDNLPTSALDTGATSCLNGGGDWVFSTDSAGVNQLACEIVRCVTSATESSTKFIARVRLPTYASGNREVYAFWNRAGQSQPAAGAAFGRNACNAEFQNVYNLEEAAAGPFIDSTGNTDGATATNASKLTSVTAAKASLADGIDFDGTIGSSIKNASSISAYPFTLSAWAKIESFSNGTFLSLAQSNANDELLGIRTNDGTGGNKLQIYHLSASGFLSSSSASSYALNELVFAEAVWRSSTDAELYINGVSEATANFGKNIPSSPRNFGLGAIPRLSETGLNDCEIYYATTRTTATTLAQTATTYSNQNDPSTFWTAGTVFVPGGSDYSITLDAGSYTLTGSSVALKAGRKLALSSGAYTYTGSSAALAANRKVSLSAGSYSYTGNSASLKADRKLSLTGGSYAYTGSSATLKAGRKLPIDVGSYTYTGSSVTLTYNALGGPTYALTLDAGSYALTGNAVGLAANRKLLLGSAAYNYTGQTVSLVANRVLSLSSGAYTYTGSSKDLKANRSLSLDVGAYVYTGQSVTLNYSGLVVKVIASYTINFKSDIITATFADDDHTIGFK